MRIYIQLECDKQEPRRYNVSGDVFLAIEFNTIMTEIANNSKNASWQNLAPLLKVELLVGHI